MDQRISLITLGVADLPRSRAFYEALGWSGQEVEETGLQAGQLALVLCGPRQAGRRLRRPDRPPDGSFDGIALVHNVRSREGGDGARGSRRVARRHRHARPPAENSHRPGHAACFADPDGHIWTFAHNPGFTLAEDGALRLPKFA